DVVETAGRVRAPGGGCLRRRRREHEQVVRQQGAGGRALRRHRRGVLNRRHRRVGRDEVDQRLLMAQPLAELEPVGGRRQRRVVRLREQLLARLVESGDSFTASPRQVDRRQVEGQADEGVADRRGDELVELVGDLLRQTVDQRARRLRRGQRSGGGGTRG